MRNPRFYYLVFTLMRLFSKTHTMKKGFVFMFAMTIGLLTNAQQNQNKNLNQSQTRAGLSSGLTKEEKKMMDYIDANMPRAIALLKESVNINSGSLNIEGVKKLIFNS